MNIWTIPGEETYLRNLDVENGLLNRKTLQDMDAVLEENGAKVQLPLLFVSRAAQSVSTFQPKTPLTRKKRHY